MELYLYSRTRLQAWFLIKHRKNFNLLYNFYTHKMQPYEKLEYQLPVSKLQLLCCQINHYFVKMGSRGVAPHFLKLDTG
jgi:hypothetical protein